MPVPTQLLRDPEEIGAAVASLILDRYTGRRSGRRFLLGCPGGRSLQSGYRCLSALAAQREIDLSALVIVMMDEYVIDTPTGYASVGDDLPHSCRRFGREEIVGRLNAGRPPEQRVPAEHLWLPDPADPSAYEERIAAAGGIDLFLLASGTSDGHVAFNPPGAGADTRTRVVALPDSTRRDNLATFPTFGGQLDAVPEHGVTVGIATIREHSAEVAMVVHGADKAYAAHRLAAATAYEPDWPATVLVECRSPMLFLDQEAASALPADSQSPRKVNH